MPKSNKQSLIIDCQVFQTASWHRGMGKYSMAFLEGVSTHQALTDCAVTLLFNRALERNEEAESWLKNRFADAEFVYLDLAVPKEPRTEHSIEPVRLQNARQLDMYIQKNFEGTTKFLILALYLDEVCPVFPNLGSVEKLVIYYDAIPYLYSERYGRFAGFFEHFYMPHTATVYKADKLLTISKTVANDLHITFGIPRERIFNIDGASIPRENIAEQAPRLKSVKEGRYILMPTGQELRKNNLRAVRAFEQYRTETNEDVYLVVTSFFTEEGRQELQALSDHVVFSGNVSEAEMLWLFQHCRLVLFPSEYEGLGLPVLEAVEQNKPIACSDISVFREISKSAFHFFDPLNVDSMAETLKTAMERHTGVLSPKEYRRIMEKYTWHNTAAAFFEALSSPVLAVGVQKKRIAIFCPEPTGFSAIGKVVTESHAWYSQYFDITYYFDQGPNHRSIRPSPLRSLAPCYNAEDFTEANVADYDALVYHIGNSEYHLNIIRTALAFPGYVILHDTHLGGAYANLSEEGHMSPERIALEQKLDKLVSSSPAKQKTSGYLTSIANRQYAVITHSDYALKAVGQKVIASDVRVQKINLPVDTPIYPEIVQSMDEQVNIAFAGIIARVKGTDVIEMIAKSDGFADCRINIFGYSAVEPERLEKLKALPHVTLVTNPSDHMFQTLMAGTDILVNVRLAYKGETSLTTLEAMRFGATVVVRDFGWYAELPDTCVVKVSDPEAAIGELGKVLRDSRQIESIRRAAISYIEANHSHQAYAKGMFDLVSRQV